MAHMGGVQGVLVSPGIEVGRNESDNILGALIDRWNAHVLQCTDGRKGKLQLLLKVAQL